MSHKIALTSHHSFHRFFFFFSTHSGATALKRNDYIQIRANPDIAAESCLTWLISLFIPTVNEGCCMPMLCYQQSEERSYLYVRENSFEMNIGKENCVASTCSCCLPIDKVTVNYFDLEPFVLNPACGCNSGEPKIKKLEPGCMICCVKFDAVAFDGACAMCIEPHKAVVTPFDTTCCCCANDTQGCDNYFGFCGGITGNPKMYWQFPIQPLNADEFVTYAEKALEDWRLSQPSKA